MGIDRKLQRAELRTKYERFCAAWKNEKRFQEYTLADGGKIPEGQFQLGRKPTFQMWKAAYDNKQLERPVDPETKPTAVEVTDTEWTDEEVV